MIIVLFFVIANYIHVALSQDFFIGQIITVASSFCPEGTLECDGSFIPIAQNSALFSLLGIMYGGNGVSTFQLPDLRGRVEVGVDPISNRKPQGYSYGVETVLPTWSSIMTFPPNTNVNQCGGGSATLYSVPVIPVSQPSLVFRKCIVVQGIYPARP